MVPGSGEGAALDDQKKGGRMMQATEATKLVCVARFILAKACACGARYDEAGWLDLRKVAPQDDGKGGLLEQRNCAFCHSTLARALDTHAARLSLTRRVLGEVSAKSRLQVEDILDDEHSPTLAKARRAVMVAMWRHGISIEQISRLLARSRVTVRAYLVRDLGPDFHQAKGRAA